MDEWEIEPGDSLRKKIFDEGISGCDLFFIYLTENSKDSYWCEKELDAAFVHEVDKRGGFLALFVDSDETRSALSLDLKSLNVPVLSEDDYLTPVLKLVAKAWKVRLGNRLSEAQEATKASRLELEKRIAEQQLLIERLQSAGASDTATIIDRLSTETIIFPDETVSLLDAFSWLANRFASGANTTILRRELEKHIDLGESHEKWSSNYWSRSSEVTGPLVINGLVTIRPPDAAYDVELFYLTELGARVARDLADAA